MPQRTSTRRPGRKLLNHDRKLGCRFVAGVDEVGRGCLAGPLVTAAVAFDYSTLTGPAAAPLGHLDDSKKLTVQMREKLYDAVIAAATSWSVVVVAPATIDRVGLHRSNLRALGHALSRLRLPVDVALVDGFHLGEAAPQGLECMRIVKGDATSAAIAAASVLAKVTRDRLMARLDAQLDGRWAFAEHMGYATELHHERIASHGMSDHHRRSFDSLAYRALDGNSEGVPDVVDPFDPTVAIAVHEEDVEAVVLDAAL